MHTFPYIPNPPLWIGRACQVHVKRGLEMAQLRLANGERFDYQYLAAGVRVALWPGREPKGESSRGQGAESNWEYGLTASWMHHFTAVAHYKLGQYRDARRHVTTLLTVDGACSSCCPCVQLRVPPVGWLCNIPQTDGLHDMPF